MIAISSASAVVSAAQLQGLDLETALMTVQSQRATLLEDQLKGQLEEVQQRNAQIGKLNEALSAGRELSARFSDKDSSSDKISSLINKERDKYEDTQEWKDKSKAIKASFKKTDTEQDRERMLEVPDNCTVTGRSLEKMTTAAASANISLKVENKGELTTAIENLKSMIDSQSNSQQMDMLRLQSLSNKRNEAFEVMTNFIKKMQDSRSSILGNTR